MSNILSYRGYQARVDFDADDGIFFGRVADVRDGIGFHADNVAALKQAFEEAIDDYLETCARLGREPQRLYSGRVMLRVEPALHARVALAAQLAGKSINQWGEDVLRKALG